LLHLLDATGGVIRLSGQILHLGKGLAPSAAEQLLGLLHADAAGEVLAVNSLAQRYPQLAVLAQNGSGALLQPLGYSAGDTILWFRREQSSIVTWGGSPDDEAAALGSRLGPRASFTAWQQVIRNQSAPWTQVDLAMASEVARAVGTEMVRRTKTELDRMRDASRSKSRFLANVSHELRTPLHGIIGYAELVVGEGGLSLTQVTRVEAVQAASQRLLQLIDRVLEFSEVDAEAIALHVVPVDAREAALASVDAVRPAAAAKGLRLHMAVVPSTPRHLLADGTQLQQVLANLLGNAVKFADAGAVELNLMPASRGARIRFEVVDSGPGIPAEQRAMLFQGFERFDVAGDKLNDGAGLGLAIAARLAGLMGGRLGHEPNPAGGSIFWLELPAEGAAASAPATQRKADGAASPQEGLRVLVVDDVLMNRDIAASFLRAAGHQVAFAEDGLQAVKAVEALDFDVVLMDIRMPVMDGLEATRRIRELPGYRGTVPIVAVTAQTFQDQVRQCRSAGMQGHLGKPFDPALLHASVTQAASGRRPRSLLAQPEAVTVHPAPGKAVQGADLPVLDVAMLERTAAFLPADAVNSYLSTIAGLATSLLAGLQQPDALIRKSTELAEAAHTLAGSAGMFGFVRVTSLGRSFQRAVQTADAETPSIAAGLRAAVEATLQAVRARAA
jgi:two-component system sensor histidine kinase/response regulator